MFLKTENDDTYITVFCIVGSPAAPTLTQDNGASVRKGSDDLGQGVKHLHLTKNATATMEKREETTTRLEGREQ